jgi:hypothetical protein
MQGPGQVLSSEKLQVLLGKDLMPLFRLILAQMAASCAAMAGALKDASAGRQVPFPLHSSDRHHGGMFLMS